MLLRRLILISLTLLVQKNVQCEECISFKNVVALNKYYKAPFEFGFMINSKSINQTTFRKNNFDADVIWIHNQTIPILCEGAVTNFDRVHILNITRNGITEIRLGAFRNLTKILKLDLSGNRIGHLRYGVFNHNEITELYLTRNEIKIIEPKAFSQMEKLKEIDLSFNKIRTWDFTWFKKSPLQHVNFEYNYLSELPEQAFSYLDDFSRLTEVLYINFNHNIISKVHPTSLPNVEIIWFLLLEHNKLTNLPVNLLQNVSRIEALKIGHNRFRTFPRELLQDTEVKYLKLDHNSLYEFDDVNLTEIIDLSFNPLGDRSKTDWERRKIMDRAKFENYFGEKLTF